MSKELARDKRTIDSGLVDAKQYLMEGNLDMFAKTLSRITPTSRRISYKEFQVNIMTCKLYMKKEQFDKAREFAAAASRLNPDDALSWKFLLQIDTKIENPKIGETITKALDTCKPDADLIKLVVKHLNELNDEKITKLFIRTLEAMPDGLDLPITQDIPEIPCTLDLRLRMLKRQAPKDPEICSRLIHTILEESNIFEAPKYIKTLPIDNQDRLYVETLLGDTPLESAKKHMQTGSEIFNDFVLAAKKNDLPAIRHSISLIPPFVSGWMYYIEHLTVPQQKLNAINDALVKYPNYVPLMIKLSEAKEELGDTDGAISIIKNIISFDPYIGTPLLVKILIRLGRGSEAEKLMDEDVEKFITPEERARIDLLMYKTDKNKDRLRRILSIESTPGNAVAKAEAAFELKDELGEDCQKYFIEAMKTNKENPIGYMIFGRYQLEVKKDEDKAVFLFRKAYELGLEDPVLLELTSRSLIQHGDLDEALRLCQKVDTNWSHFRAGLILQRQGNHEEACEEFQHDLRHNKDRKESWSAIGHSYIVLGRAMAAVSVAQQLRENGNPDLDLEYQIDSIFGAPILVHEYSEEAFGLKESPIRYYSFIQQCVTYLRVLSKFHRKEACQDIMSKTVSLTDKFVELWGKNASVLKASGDYYIEVFNVSGNASYVDKAQKLYMKRAEIDCRAEAFIDLAHSLHLKNKDEMAVTVLRRALKSFSDHSGLWMNLGIAFALTSHFPFSRHCLCVAAKLATSTEMARSYACVAAIALMIDDEKLLKVATNAARSFNPYDPDVWQILIKTGEVNKREASRIAFDFGASSNIIDNLPLFSLQAGQPKDALGFAMMSGNRNLISDALEADGKYEFALLFADDEERRNRLIKFSNPKLMNQNTKELAAIFDKTEEPLRTLGLAALKLSEGDKQTALDSIMSVLGNHKLAQPVAVELEKIALRIAPKEVKVEAKNADTDPIEFLIQAKRTMSTYDAAKAAWQRFDRNIPIVKNFVMEILRSQREEDYELAIKAIQAALKVSGDREIYRLLSVLQMRTSKFKEAYGTLQTLCILSPSLIQRLKPIMKELVTKI